MVSYSVDLNKPNMPELRFSLPELQFPDKLNVAEYLLDRHIRAGKGDRVAILYGEEKITYGELYTRTNRLGNAFKQLGIGYKDAVIVRTANVPQFHEIALAVHKIGGILVPSMMLLKESTITFCANLAEAKAIVTSADLLDEVEKGRDKYETVEHIIVFGGDPTALKAKGYICYEEIIDNQSSVLDPFLVDKMDPGYIGFTSGTTGEPKGCLHPQVAPLAIAVTTDLALQYQENDVFGGTPPLAFIYGYCHLFLIPLYKGAVISLIKGRATPESSLQTIEKHKITYFHAVPTMYNMILREKGLKGKYDLSSVRVFLSSGAPLLQATFDEWKKEYGYKLINIIGSHETFGSYIGTWQQPIKPGSIGNPYPGYEVVMLDDDGNLCSTNIPGRVGVKGPTGIIYLKRPQKQAEAILNGYSLSGDVGYVDEDNCIWLVSRSDDVIKSRAYRISPESVENALIEHPQIHEAGVIGVPHELEGQRVKAFIVMKSGVRQEEVDFEEIRNFCLQKLAPYMVPKEIEITVELPKTETGKIKRGELRKIEDKRRTKSVS
ncbi:acyl-CoA synthetase [candidate division WWE3 bacterium]|jgi:2-aminobenzoate-CoA ligase|uniref:Acyl-CoA synthetase n=1 Tax=candidate division WWE3 bacterium TaxID=2053526 RepID=A0A3A4ZDD7_UNCKA|nr:MAG: acyl-CoA synthetase [candidate division WWE3 bacterium]